MPVPGQPRNPLGQTPDRFRLSAPRFVVLPGETPGTMEHDLHQDTQAAGTIRRLWRQAVDYIGTGSGPFSWTNNAAVPGQGAKGLGQVTRALRYLASTRYVGAGNFLRYGAPRPLVPGRHAMRPVTVQGGNRQNKPTIRNRLTSFGSRVPALNSTVPAREES